MVLVDAVTDKRVNSLDSNIGNIDGIRDQKNRVIRENSQSPPFFHDFNQYVLCNSHELLPRDFWPRTDFICFRCLLDADTLSFFVECVGQGAKLFWAKSCPHLR